MSANIRDTVVQAVAELAATSPTQISGSDRLDADLDLDSLTRAELLSTLETRFDVEIADDLIDQLLTVDAVVAEVTRQLRDS
jgi:acyl carrier protein